MGLEAEVEALRRQNRRLKVALCSTLGVLLLAMLMAVGVVGITAMRARAEAQRALEMERVARVHAEKAMMQAQRLLDEAAEEQVDEP